jgi:uncharacterized protein YjlB
MKQYSGRHITHFLLKDDGTFPNNSQYAVVIYRHVLELEEKKKKAARQLKKIFKRNDWTNSWRDGIHDYHHYHSVTHEVLGISNGKVTLLLGGEEGKTVHLKKGDVIVIPAGVAHKCVKSSKEFECVGAYPGGTDYDMNYGYPKERPYTDENIAKVKMPEADPVFGADGPLFKYWGKKLLPQEDAPAIIAS